MTNISQKVSEELAVRDLADINELRRSEVFERYFMRRVRQKKAEAEGSLKYDSSLTPDKRESTRLLYLAYEGIEKMLDTDEGMCHAALRRGVSAEPRPQG